MNIQDKDKIINGLIKENSDNTIRDYMECMAEINGIKPASFQQKQIKLLIAVDELEDKIRANQRRNCLKRDIHDRMVEDKNDLTELQRQSRERHKKTA